MQTKIVIPAFATILLIVIAGYFLFNPSYEKSIQAKYYYETGEYKEAYTLAKEAFSLDLYNRMASTIMAQSKTSLKYVSYVEDSRKYIKQIDEIASNDIISDANKAKMKIICEIMINRYIKLAPSVITDNDLVQDSAKYNSMFEKLLEKVN